MKKIGFSGTLDPITNGHMWVIGEARSLADEVTVFISENPLKTAKFSAQERKKIIERSAAECGWDNVSVVMVRGYYTARTAKKQGIDYLVRGIRNTADFDYENLIQQTNVDVLGGAKTIFVMPPRDLGSVSSSFIKALQGPVGWHWTMKKFVPAPAYHAWIIDWLRKEWTSLWKCEAASRAAVNAEHWFEQLTGASSYGGPARRYHNLDHLVHGLTEINVWAANVQPTPQEIGTVKKAYWFHDAVYGQHGKVGTSDEEASAQLWKGSGLDMLDAGGPADLIRATDHFQQGSVTHALKDIMLGADLAILGQSADVYDAYAAAIREENSHLAWDLYKKGRRSALLRLRDRAIAGNLYGDRYFAELYNESALANLAREIGALDEIR